MNGREFRPLGSLAEATSGKIRSPSARTVRHPPTASGTPTETRDREPPDEDPRGDALGSAVTVTPSGGRVLGRGEVRTSLTPGDREVTAVRDDAIAVPLHREAR